MTLFNIKQCVQNILNISNDNDELTVMIGIASYIKLKNILGHINIISQNASLKGQAGTRRKQPYWKCSKIQDQMRKCSDCVIEERLENI